MELTGKGVKREDQKLAELQSVDNTGSVKNAYLILIVEDDSSLAELYSLQLREVGYEVEWLTNGEAALERICEEPHPDVMLLDVKLEGMDGIDVMRHVLARFPSMKVILHSAYHYFKHDMAAWGADAFVEKSYDDRALKDALKRVLRKKEQKGA